MSLDEGNRIGRAAERVRRRSRASLKVLLPTAAALGAGAAVAIGQIPGTDGTITACYQDVPQGTNGADYPFGTVRIIDPNAVPDNDPTWPNNACGPNEHILTWNQQGPPGPTGPQGPVGPQGPIGSQGAPGTVVGQTVFSISASQTDRLLMKLDGITGGVTEKTFKGDIELSSFAVGAEAAVTGVGGAGAGKVNIQSFSFVKKADRADPELAKHLGNSQTIKLADVAVYHVSKTSKSSQLVEAADYKLTNVVITAIQQNGATERVSGTFQKLQGTVGTGPNKVSTGWDLKTSKAP
jgi:type VI secretion system Hcp family effector